MKMGYKGKKNVIALSVVTMVIGLLIGINTKTNANIAKTTVLNNNSITNEEAESLTRTAYICQDEGQEYVITKVNEKKAKTRAIRFVEYFTRQQFSMIVEMQEKDKQLNSSLNYDMFKNTYDKYFIGNKYVNCNKFNYYGYLKEKDIHVIDVFIQGKYRINKVQLSFNSSWGLNGFYYYSYSEPIPEMNSTFKEEVIEIGEHKLKGLLTIPNVKELKPVVILVQGSGYQNADAAVGENRMFANIAHGLAKEGVATLRYNERFNQCAELIESNNTIYTEIIDDAVAAVKQMSVDNRIDKNKIFIIGHDLGGLVAPKIAEKCPQVKGIISLAGTPRNYVDVMYDNDLLKFVEITKFKDQKEEEKKNKTISDDDFNEEMNYVKEFKNKLKVEFNNIRIIRSIKTASNKIIQGFSEAYWKSIHDLNVEANVSKIKVPMFIMQGTADVIITENRDYVEWQRILDGKAKCRFKTYKDLNHMFMKTKGNSILDIEEEHKSKGTVDENVIKDIASFVKDNSK